MLSWVAHGKILEPRCMGRYNFSLLLKHVGKNMLLMLVFVLIIKMREGSGSVVECLT